MDKFGDFKVDLSASRGKKQLPFYVVWNSEPFTLAIDSFTIDWSKFKGV